MNAPDTNLLLYAYNSNDPRHSRAKSYWEKALAGGEPVGIPVICVQGSCE